MARFCTNGDCRRYDHPLPRDAGACPDCGSTEHRVDASVSTTRCSACDTPNEGGRDDCWNCGAAFDDRSRSIDLG